MSPRVGARLPSLLLRATRGEPVDLSALPGISVIYIYPYTGRLGVPDPPGWDDTPGAHGSTPQTEGFCDLASSFAEIAVRLFGLSSQTTDWQREMVQRLGVPFPVLSDADFAFADALGLPRFMAGEGVFLERLTFVAEDGVIVRVFHPVRDPAGHAAQVLAAMKSECIFVERQ